MVQIRFSSAGLAFGDRQVLALLPRAPVLADVAVVLNANDAQPDRLEGVDDGKGCGPAG